jgi:hypothetical protein
VKIAFAGTIGRSGLGGQAWANLQYLLGFRALGHEVFYLEDCGSTSWVYDWEKSDWTYALDYPAACVRACLEPFGLDCRWIYRTDTDSRGAPLSELTRFCAEAEVLIVRAVPLWVWRPEYDRTRRRAFIDVDPGFTQISVANGDRGLAEGIARCERRFTIGQRLGDPGCVVPTAGGPWLKTLPPVFLPEWPCAQSEETQFTSILRWQGFKDVAYRGVSYGQRDREFPDYLDLPRLTRQKIRIAQMGADPRLLAGHGWEVLPGEVISRTPASYREFIRTSRAEFGVAKHGYVKMQSGWFSDRSVCYLASGRPVLVENTGLDDWLPVGEGVVTFHDPAGAIAGMDRINSDYERHRRAARELAERIFDSDRVLDALLEAAMD